MQGRDIPNGPTSEGPLKNPSGTTPYKPNEWQLDDERKRLAEHTRATSAINQAWDHAKRAHVAAELSSDAAIGRSADAAAAMIRDGRSELKRDPLAEMSGFAQSLTRDTSRENAAAGCAAGPSLESRIAAALDEPNQIMDLLQARQSLVFEFRQRTRGYNLQELERIVDLGRRAGLL